MFRGKDDWFNNALTWLARGAFVAVCAFVFVLPARPSLAGFADIVVDAGTGKILHEVNADKRRYPASLTKMMTLYLTFGMLESGRLSLGKRLKVSRRATRQAPSRLGVRAGTTISVKNAILGLVTKSANDIATVLAEAIGGSEPKFAQMMTDKARALGMASTTFRNASGLHSRRQVTTARDMARLARALITDYPQYYHFFGTRRFRYDGHTYPNHNKLLRTYEGADGIKTGYVRAAGFNLVASAERDGQRLIGVILGDRSPRARNAKMTRLLDAAFLSRTAFYAALVSKPQRRSDGTIAAAPPPRAVLATASKRGWGVQVGAFSRFALAHLAVTRAARNAPTLLLHARVTIVPVRGKAGMVYRARLVGLDERRARQACDTLAVKKLSCVAVPPDVSLAQAESPR